MKNTVGSHPESWALPLSLPTKMAFEILIDTARHVVVISRQYCRGRGHCHYLRKLLSPRLLCSEACSD